MPGILTLYSEGTITVVYSLVLAMFMPEYPHKERLLKPIERDDAVWRLEMEVGAGELNDEITVWKGFKMAFFDPKIWVDGSWVSGRTRRIFPYDKDIENVGGVS